MEHVHQISFFGLTQDQIDTFTFLENLKFSMSVYSLTLTASNLCIYGAQCNTQHQPCVICIGLNMVISDSVYIKLTGAALQAMQSFRQWGCLPLLRCNDSYSNNIIMEDKQANDTIHQTGFRNRRKWGKQKKRGMQRANKRYLKFIGIAEVIYILPYWNSRVRI